MHHCHPVARADPGVRRNSDAKSMGSDGLEAIECSGGTNVLLSAAVHPRTLPQLEYARLVGCCWSGAGSAVLRLTRSAQSLLTVCASCRPESLRRTRSHVSARIAQL